MPDTPSAVLGGGPIVLGDWQCAGLPAGSVQHPKELDGLQCEWFPAPVPGTVASALRSLGRTRDAHSLDERDWWFRCRIEGRPGRWALELDGVATVADVWMNGDWVLHAENMHRAHRVMVELPDEVNELVVRCAALAPLLAVRRERPRWKCGLLEHQGMRWVRTSLLGRIRGWATVPPAVGMWRPVRLVAAGSPEPTDVVLHAAPDGADGVVRATFCVPGIRDAGTARLRVGSTQAAFDMVGSDGGVRLTGELRVPAVERWWPHTHGPQPLYDVWADLDGASYRLGAVGFRTVELERDGDGFALAVNGVPVFCRGAVWLPVDPVAVRASDNDLAHRLALVREANMNMLRVPGTAVYEDRRFLDRCDALGILVWHDCMFAFFDPPDDAVFTQEAMDEVTEATSVMSGHPCIAVVCGNQEVQEIASMNGVPSASAMPLFDEVVPAIVDRVLPGVPYVTSNPVGGELPFRMDRGVSQYFGVGGYFRTLADVRLARVRFAAECLAYSTPPEPVTVEEACGGAYRAGHDPEWKHGVHHDAGRSWDMEDVRDFYVQSVFEVDPLTERRRSPERSLELGRAVNAQLMGAVMSEWRRPGSGSGGGLVLAFGDLRAGAGWGVVDALGRPKAPWYVLRRLFRPVALLAVDEGLNGLALHVVNDTPEPFCGQLEVALVAGGDTVTDEGSRPVAVGARASASFDAESVLGGFRDVVYSYQFSAPSHDAMVAILTDEHGTEVSQVVHFPAGSSLPLEHDVGLSAVARQLTSERWELEVRADRLAQWVTVRAAGFEAEDSWFHLPPAAVRTLALRSTGGTRPRGVVAALNARTRATIRTVS